MASTLARFRSFNSPSGQRWQWRHSCPFRQPPGFQNQAQGLHVPEAWRADPMEANVPEINAASVKASRPGGGGTEGARPGGKIREGPARESVDSSQTSVCSEFSTRNGPSMSNAPRVLSAPLERVVGAPGPRVSLRSNPSDQCDMGDIGVLAKHEGTTVESSLMSLESSAPTQVEAVCIFAKLGLGSSDPSARNHNFLIKACESAPN
mmetsp:Transcript_39719/g.105144  ORF Transcript_39719/g.105144 Transcript_39719/m.105144 type:complete len:207 (+) Transcript_39719:887-1507(+)